MSLMGTPHWSPQSIPKRETTRPASDTSVPITPNVIGNVYSILNARGSNPLIQAEIKGTGIKCIYDSTVKRYIHQKGGNIIILIEKLRKLDFITVFFNYRILHRIHPISHLYFLSSYSSYLSSTIIDIPSGSSLRIPFLKSLSPSSNSSLPYGDKDVATVLLPKSELLKRIHSLPSLMVSSSSSPSSSSFANLPTYLTNPFLMIQIGIPSSTSSSSSSSLLPSHVSFDIEIMDKKLRYHRLSFSTAFQTPSGQELHAQIPLLADIVIARSSSSLPLSASSENTYQWTALCLSLDRLCSYFFNETFGYLTSIRLSSVCRIRSVTSFQTSSSSSDSICLPPQCDFPENVPYSLSIIDDKAIQHILYSSLPKTSNPSLNKFPKSSTAALRRNTSPAASLRKNALLSVPPPGSSPVAVVHHPSSLRSSTTSPIQFSSFSPTTVKSTHHGNSSDNDGKQNNNNIRNNNSKKNNKNTNLSPWAKLPIKDVLLRSIQSRQRNNNDPTVRNTTELQQYTMMVDNVHFSPKVIQSIDPSSSSVAAIVSKPSVSPFDAIKSAAMEENMNISPSSISVLSQSLNNISMIQGWISNNISVNTDKTNYDDDDTFDTLLCTSTSPTTPTKVKENTFTVRMKNNDERVHNSKDSKDTDMKGNISSPSLSSFETSIVTSSSSTINITPAVGLVVPVDPSYENTVPFPVNMVPDNHRDGNQDDDESEPSIILPFPQNDNATTYDYSNTSDDWSTNDQTEVPEDYQETIMIRMMRRNDEYYSCTTAESIGTNNLPISSPITVPIIPTDEPMVQVRTNVSPPNIIQTSSPILSDPTLSTQMVVPIAKESNYTTDDSSSILVKKTTQPILVRTLPFPPVKPSATVLYSSSVKDTEQKNHPLWLNRVIQNQDNVTSLLERIRQNL